MMSMPKKTEFFFLILAASLCSCRPTDNGIQPSAQDKAPEKFTLSSDDFADGGAIPATLTCDGRNVSPVLRWTGTPANTVSFAITVRDPDAPGGDFLHWAAADIPAHISETPGGAKLQPPVKELENNFTALGYGGPCPPPGKPHRYVFTIYALDAAGAGGTLPELEKFLKDHTIAKSVLVGTYKRKEK